MWGFRKERAGLDLEGERVIWRNGHIAVIGRNLVAKHEN